MYFTLFNLYVSVIDGAAYRSPWCDSHPELMEYTRDGASAHCLSPIKRLADGSYYEDLLVQCVTSVARDYGFDGVHAADGYSSPRLPIWMADYSDDVVSQFTETMGIVLPDGIAPQADAPAPPARIAVRADHIWKTLRREWCEFYARRFERLFEKVCRAMHGDKRQVILNNAWTRDPLEAYDRWGIDYRRLAGAGVDKFIMETVGAGVSIGAESGFEADPRFDMNFMLAFTKAAIPNMPLLCLNGTGDTTENWDVLNHAPPVSEREIATLGHMFLQDAEGFRHASAGPLVCLADGITGPQWRWLRENWQAAYERRPGRVLGATVVWSEAALEAEIADYPLRRVLTRHKIASELQRRGGPLQVVARIEHLDATRGCLLVPRPELLPPAELSRVLDYPHGPVVTIGRQAAALPAPDLSFANGPGPDQLVCRVYHADRPIAVPEIPPSPEVEPSRSDPGPAQLPLRPLLPPHERRIPGGVRPGPDRTVRDAAAGQCHAGRAAAGLRDSRRPGALAGGQRGPHLRPGTHRHAAPGARGAGRQPLPGPAHRIRRLDPQRPHSAPRRGPAGRHPHVERDSATGLPLRA